MPREKCPVCRRRNTLRPGQPCGECRSNEGCRQTSKAGRTLQPTRKGEELRAARVEAYAAMIAAGEQIRYLR